MCIIAETSFPTALVNIIVYLRNASEDGSKTPDNLCLPLTWTDASLIYSIHVSLQVSDEHITIDTNFVKHVLVYTLYLSAYFPTTMSTH